MLALAVRVLRRARESVIDRLAIRLFFFLMRRASLRMLYCFHQELVAEMRDRLAAPTEPRKPAA